ncbi:hypothetical protein WOLCODRAFT_139998 [Wolfiporia cocos MD-104 SS10]|uniref:Uncharacterized protein n=1 Tax=Wolfiporia cocos (strain MD-104) TaxID=742152 RepID=A0A2H3J079_WOLCO|nr:hypothetical protein WOLCODRAFT_139998 [Wolfiporia cocos MD-104 SS10]
MNRAIYMNIPARRGPQEESFEERRVQDYLHSYRTTGAPPKSCPQVPTGAAERAAMGLPPLFEPLIEVPSLLPTTPITPPRIQVNGIATSIGAGPPSANLETQAFRSTSETADNGIAWFQSIVLQPEYKAYSFEELRWAAYARGRVFVQIPQPSPSPIAPSPISRTSSSPYEERYQSITCNPAFSQHSFEELRVAFLRAGRELTSAEMISQASALRFS